jgi:hypothetical protein
MRTPAITHIIALAMLPASAAVVKFSASNLAAVAVSSAPIETKHSAAVPVDASVATPAAFFAEATWCCRSAAALCGPRSLEVANADEKAGLACPDVCFVCQKCRRQLPLLGMQHIHALQALQKFRHAVFERKLSPQKERAIALPPSSCRRCRHSHGINEL